MIWLALFIGAILGYCLGVLMSSGGYAAGYEDGQKDRMYTEQLRRDGVIE